VKLAFDYIYFKICLTQLLQNELNMNFMFKFIIQINQDVIQINNTKLIQMFAKSIIDVLLKQDRLVTQIKEHD